MEGGLGKRLGPVLHEAMRVHRGVGQSLDGPIETLNLQCRSLSDEFIRLRDVQESSGRPVLERWVSKACRGEIPHRRA